MYNYRRIIPYISLIIVTILLFVISKYSSNPEIIEISTNLFSNGIFFFVIYLFYDIVRQLIIYKEKKSLNDYIKNKIANDIFVALYYLKKIIHGYNLDTNTLKNIFSIINYSKREIENSIKNQNYFGFQIFKNMNEVRDLFQNILNDNFILKYSTHNDSINILRISNNLTKLEFLLKDLNNYNNCAESVIEFIAINGKSLNPENDEKFLLVKKTKHKDRFVVYDSGYFDEKDTDNILNRYVLKNESVKNIAYLVYETFSLMNKWIPGAINLNQNENRFRIIKEFFSPKTNLKTKNTKIYVADIVESK